MERFSQEKEREREREHVRNVIDILQQYNRVLCYSPISKASRSLTDSCDGRMRGAKETLGSTTSVFHSVSLNRSTLSNCVCHIYIVQTVWCMKEYTIINSLSLFLSFTQSLSHSKQF